MNLRFLLSSFIVFISMALHAQNVVTPGEEAANTSDQPYQNSTDAMLNASGKLGIGGYGEVHYNQPLNKDQTDLGTLDLHRMVMFLGYNFSKNTSFVSEIEFEYAKELWVEQAFLQHKISKFINFRAGLMLVPMGIINEYHEPTTFNGVERPIIDNRIAPSTWREIGAGFSGNVLPASLKYQLYVMNGLSSYDTKGLFTGAAGMREGRQKGSKAYIHSPSFSGKIEYYGLKNLNVGLSAYSGKSQSKLFNRLHNDSVNLVNRADSSIVGINMLGADGRYQTGGLELRAQFYFTSFSNTLQYNKFTAVNGKKNDLGASMTGYYIEAGYNILRNCNRTNYELIPFVRYEFYNTHNSVDEATVQNLAYENIMITTGLTFKLTSNAVLKADLQFAKSADATEYKKVFNAGIGVTF